MTKDNAVSFNLKVDPKKDDSASFKAMVCVLEGNKTINDSCVGNKTQTRSSRDSMLPLWLNN